MSATLYRYQPVVIPGPLGSDFRPRGPDGDSYRDTLTELAELEGWRYVTVPEGVSPTIPEQIVDTWEAVSLTAATRDALKAASPHCQLARERFVDAIRAKHSLDDELYYARIATGSLLGTYTLQPGESDRLATYQADVEAARETLHQRYTELGL